MKKSYFSKLIAFVFAVVLSTNLSLAQYTVTGTVSDAVTGEVLIGVNVFDAASGSGASTNVDGEYTITLPSGETTLRFTSIGYITRNIEVSGSNGETVTLDVQMEADVANLDELVVTGLASNVKRSNLANSVTSISADEIAGENDPQTLDNALYGKIPGVNIIAQGGAPGGGFNVQLRGVSTLGAGSSQPLYIIDGIYVNNSNITTGRSLVSQAGGTSQDDVANRLADLNPDDIESIEVLKGASAAAIYGQRANAGVIIITTKKGKAGRTEISFQQDVGFSTALRFLDRTDWTEDRIRAFWGDGDRGDLEVQRFNEAQNSGRIRDLERELYGEEGRIVGTQLSVSTGGEKTRFFLSGNLQDEEGIIKGTGFERQSIRANVDHNINDRISVSSNTNFVHSENDRGFTGNQNTTGGSIGYTLAFTPNYAFNTLIRPDGSFGDNPYFSENPFRLRDEAINNQEVNRIMQSFNVDAELARFGSSVLNFRGTGGFDILSTNSIVYFPEFFQAQRSLPNPGEVIHAITDIEQTNIQASLIFQTQTSQEENPFFLTSQLGYSRFNLNQQAETQRGQGLAPGQTNVQNANVQLLTQNFQKVTDLGFFGQQEVNWNDKLIGTIGARLDRSTLNLDQEEYYFYPKASLAANLTNFDFWSFDVFNQFKLRVAYGETGGLPTFGSTFTQANSVNIGGNLGATRGTTTVDPGLDPERAREIEFGLDLSLLNQRLSFEGTYYNKTVEDLILPFVPANSTGIAQVATNAAELENKGVELGVNFNAIRSENLNWNANVLWWTNDSEITELNIPEQFNQAFGAPVLGGVLLREGESPTAIGGQNADGELVKFGDFQPDFQLSFGSDFNIYKNWDVSFLLHWSQGSENIQLSNLLRDSGGNTDDFFLDGSAELNPRLSDPFTTALFVEDASYLKMREASIYYNLPRSFLNNTFGNIVRGARVGVSGDNLFIITDYDGYDPEVSNFGSGQAVLQSVSVTPFPSTRRVMFHVKLDL